MGGRRLISRSRLGSSPVKLKVGAYDAGTQTLAEDSDTATVTLTPSEGGPCQALGGYRFALPSRVIGKDTLADCQLQAFSGCNVLHGR